MAPSGGTFLEGKVAVVTGGGTGIGRAISELFGAHGAAVVVNFSRSQQDAEDTARAIEAAGGAAVAVRADVSDQAQANALMSAAESHFGGLDYLINNAGWSARVPHHHLDQLTDDIWNRVFDTNLRGLFYCARAAERLLRRQPGAAMVNIASVTGLTGQGSSLAYAASKGAILTLTKSLARIFAPAVRVNAVAPGLVRTRFAAWPEAAFDKAERITPLRRLATVEDVAQAALFLAARALGTTGETLVIDGGSTRLGTSTAEFAAR